ncbi:MAG: hypothetical protein AAF198_14005 [Pseudomonadota bacterium]
MVGTLVSRLFGASIRALLVGVLLAMTLSTMPDVSAAAADGFGLFIIVICGFVLVEYGFSQPALLEFRFANPYNRWRFFTLILIMLSFVILCGNVVTPTPVNRCFMWLGEAAAKVLGFGYSPSVIMHGLLEGEVTQKASEMIIPMASLGYFIAIFSIGLFAVFVFWTRWPANGTLFHFWSNLPNFQTVQPENASNRLKQVAVLSLGMAVILPYALPAFLKSFSDILPISSFVSDFTLFWIIAVITWLPVACGMRGIALLKVSRMIRQDMMS